MKINPGLIALIVLALIHLYSNKIKVLGELWHGRFLSFAAGISFAYVFVDLLPALAKGQPAIKRTLEEWTPNFDRHTYVIALIGMLFYYGLETRTKVLTKKGFIISIFGSILLNFFIGASLYDSKDPELQPLALFTIAMGMHYFIQDHYTREKAPAYFDQWARPLFVCALIIGFIVGWITKIPDSIVALCVSFIAGGIILNVLNHELPKKTESGYLYFVIGSLLYAAILICLGDA